MRQPFGSFGGMEAGLTNLWLPEAAEPLRLAAGKLLRTTNTSHVRTGAFTAHFQTDGSKQNGAKWTDSTGVLQTGGMYPDRTLDGMMIGMRTMMTVGSVLSSPVIVDGVLYVGSTDGQLYAIR